MAWQMRKGAWQGLVAGVALTVAGVAVWELAPAGPAPAATTGMVPAAGTYGVFAEPLVPSSSYTVSQEQALLAAVTVYRRGGDPEQVQPLLAYLQRHPDSPWRASLLANLALLNDRLGYISRSIDYWQQAEVAMPKATTPAQRALADLILGEQLRLHARLGHQDELRSRLAGTAGLALSGSAGESLRQARGTLWEMENEPASVLRCGLIALHEVLAETKASPAVLTRIQQEPASAYGTSLADLDALARREGRRMAMVQREPGAAVPVPSVVHWKQGHFAAIVGQRGGRFHIRDAALDRDSWISADALDQESSGYFLTPAQSGQHGWHQVSAHTGSQVIGAGPTSSTNPVATSLGDSTDCGAGQGAGSSHGLGEGQGAGGPGQDGNGDNGNKPCPPIGMPTYQVQSMLVSLSLRDQPVSYAPPKGPNANVLLAYSQAESYQPANFSYSNVGPKWTHNWLSYVQDDPAAVGSNVLLYKRGGGAWNYTGYNASNGSFAREGQTLAQLVLVSTSPLIYERRFGDGSKEVFAQSNGATMAPRRVFLTQVVDRAGNTVTLGYDSQQRLVSLTDAAGQQSTLSYQAANPLLITRITDPFGRYAQLAYDGNGRLQGITDAIGMTSTFTYIGTGGDVASMTTPYGTTTFAYGGTGIQRWVEITDPLSNKERVEFAHTAPGIAYSDPVAPTGAGNNQYLNYRNTFYWDKTAMKVAAGDYTKARIKHWLHMTGGFGVTSPVLESVKYPLENRIWYYYPNQPHPLQIGSVWKPSKVARVLDSGVTQAVSYTYNEAGNVTSRIDPLGRTTFYDYAAGNPYDVIKVRQVSGALSETVAEYTYNAQHLPLTYKDAAGHTTSYVYNAAGQVISVTNPKAEVTQYQYDTLGRLTAVINANNKTQASFTYDAAGRVATRTDSEGYTLAYQYDALNRLVRTTYPDGTTQQVAWNRLDKASYTNRLGQVTSYAYDAVRNLTAVTDPLNQMTRYDYYENGQLNKLTDAKGNITTWSRDIEGRITSKIYADGRTYSYAYDSADRLKTRTDPLGQIKQTAYTTDDHVMGYSYANPVNPTAAVSFVYESLYPRVASMEDGTGTTSYLYKAAGGNGAGGLDRETGPDGSMATIQYSYDELGRLVSRNVGPDLEGYGYDTLGRLLQHQSSLGTFTYQYLGETGQISVEQLAGTTWQSLYVYGDNLKDRQLQAITHPSASLSLLDSLWLWFLQLIGQAPVPVGQVPTVNYTTGPEFRILTRQDAGGTRSYSYDAKQRLLSDGTTTYTYDAVDNLIGGQNSFGALTMPANSVNQLISRNSVPSVYDANGNVLDDGRNTYAWDAENRLIKITSKTTGRVSEFRYDGLSRRVAILERASATATPVETRYLWCGSQICQARSTAGLLQARYFPQGEVNLVSGSLTPTYYARDHLGSVLQVLNASGVIVGEQRYGDYGGLIYSSGTAPTFGYAGMFQHNQSGLNLTWYRAYDQASGRWLSRDPIEEAGGLNLYGYVGGNPVNFSDPLGLWTWDFNAGGHVWLPMTAGAAGLNLGASYEPDFSDARGNGLAVEYQVGTLLDMGVSAGIGGLSGVCGGEATSLNFGMGKYLGLQLGFMDGRFDGISLGLGAGLSLPINYTMSIQRLLGSYK